MTSSRVSMAWDESLASDLRALLRLGLDEDLSSGGDLTTNALVPAEAQGRARVVARSEGVVAGMATGTILFEEMGSDVVWSPAVADGQSVSPGEILADVCGSARDILTGERTLLNTLSHLSGIATCTSRFVAAVAGTGARIYDTRKTLPGWRRLQKYAVVCGGGYNHRRGLDDAVLIKDNHLCFGELAGEGTAYDVAAAVRQARASIDRRRTGPAPLTVLPIVEVEVDSLAQLQSVLPAEPDIVLLDNMAPQQLREAVALRHRVASRVALEASGGITLSSVRSVAESGVERISVGALTHSVQAMDIALDWQTQPS